MAERREHKRVRKRVQVEYGEDELEHRAYAADISIGGIFLNCRPEPLGTRLHLHILDKTRDFYVEAEVVRQRRVDPRLRSIEKEGMGLRFLTPEELIAEAVPRTERARETDAVVCEDVAAVRTLLSEQIYSRIIVVPVSEPPPASGTVVEFSIVVEVGAGTTVEGSGRLVQVLGTSGEQRKAVLEIQNADAVRAALEAAAS